MAGPPIPGTLPAETTSAPKVFSNVNQVADAFDKMIGSPRTCTMSVAQAILKSSEPQKTLFSYVETLQKIRDRFGSDVVPTVVASNVFVQAPKTFLLLAAKTGDNFVKVVSLLQNETLATALIKDATSVMPALTALAALKEPDQSRVIETARDFPVQFLKHPREFIGVVSNLGYFPREKELISFFDARADKFLALAQVIALNAELNSESDTSRPLPNQEFNMNAAASDLFVRLPNHCVAIAEALGEKAKWFFDHLDDGRVEFALKSFPDKVVFAARLLHDALALETILKADGLSQVFAENPQKLLKTLGQITSKISREATVETIFALQYLSKSEINALVENPVALTQRISKLTDNIKEFSIRYGGKREFLSYLNGSLTVEELGAKLDDKPKLESMKVNANPLLAKLERELGPYKKALDLLRVSLPTASPEQATQFANLILYIKDNYGQAAEYAVTLLVGIGSNKNFSPRILGLLESIVK
ncbi:hypothetical protein HZC07_01850, partial [Candidatus Micrarchaeota archaeon]|nr:hypothetical protein [Candidatus Micrarchaeota archaeon]